jgi:hypothetical protein
MHERPVKFPYPFAAVEPIYSNAVATQSVLRKTSVYSRHGDGREGR